MVCAWRRLHGGGDSQGWLLKAELDYMGPQMWWYLRNSIYQEVREHSLFLKKKKKCGLVLWSLKYRVRGKKKVQWRWDWRGCRGQSMVGFTHSCDRLGIYYVLGSVLEIQGWERADFFSLEVYNRMTWSYVVSIMMSVLYLRRGPEIKHLSSPVWKTRVKTEAKVSLTTIPRESQLAPLTGLPELGKLVASRTVELFSEGS